MLRSVVCWREKEILNSKKKQPSDNRKHTNNNQKNRGESHPKNKKTQKTGRGGKQTTQTTTGEFEKTWNDGTMNFFGGQCHLWCSCEGSFRSAL